MTLFIFIIIRINIERNLVLCLFYFLDRQDMDQLFLKRDRLLAQLNEISESTDIGNNLSLTSSSHNKQPISKTHSDPTKSVDSQDDEGEEGEISESD